MSCRGDRASPVIGPLHDGAATSLLLGSIGVLPSVNLSPYGWNHKVASVVAVVDQRESRFGDLDTRTVEILLETGIELSQTTVFEISHTLLLVLDITTRSEFVSRHREGEGEGERERGGRAIKKGGRVRRGYCN